MKKLKFIKPYHISLIVIVLFGVTQMASSKPNIDTKTFTDTYRSLKYGYTINIPDGFKKMISERKNIDLKLIDGANSILINVTSRLKEEYSITAHDYSAKMFESEIRKSNPAFKIVKTEKTYIDQEKAFLIYYTDASPLRAIECYIFYKDNAYVITATCETKIFSTYENLFLKTIKSLKFKK